MKGNLMTWTKMLEAMDELQSNVDMANEESNPDLLDTPVMTTTGMGGTNNDEELLNDLNQIFTPILVMQSFEGIAEHVAETCSKELPEDSVLLERNIIKFDDASRMAQLTSVCALLIARQKNTEQYKMYKKAAEMRNAMKLEIQKQEYAAAQTLAQKFLVRAATGGKGEALRQAANNLLPQTQQ